jgi:hypothetical protein
MVHVRLTKVTEGDEWVVLAPHLILTKARPALVENPAPSIV